MRTASTLIRAATVAAIAIGLTAQPTLAQTNLRPAGAGAEQAADKGGKAPVKTAGKARNGPRLKSLGGKGPKPGAWVDDQGKVHERDFELKGELIELNEITNGGFPPLKETVRIGFEIGSRLPLGQRVKEAFMKDWKNAKTVDDKVRVARYYLKVVRLAIEGARRPDFAPIMGNDSLNTSLRRLKWLEANIADTTGESVIDDLQSFRAAASRGARSAVHGASDAAKQAARPAAHTAAAGTRMVANATHPRVETPKHTINVEVR